MFPVSHVRTTHTQFTHPRDHLITALFSLSPVYVTTYKSGAQNSNSLSQLMMVDRGALIRNGPLVCPCTIQVYSLHNIQPYSSPN